MWPGSSDYSSVLLLLLSRGGGLTAVSGEEAAESFLLIRLRVYLQRPEPERRRVNSRWWEQQHEVNTTTVMIGGIQNSHVLPYGMVNGPALVYLSGSQSALILNHIYPYAHSSAVQCRLY